MDPGRSLGPDAAANLGRSSSPDAAAEFDRAIMLARRYLDRRERTVSEMQAHLARRALAADVVEEAIALLVEAGALDDARFARLFAEDRRELENWGAERIRQALLARGVGRADVDAALAGHNHRSELERAVAVLRRRFPTPPADRRGRDHALGVLARKGYDIDVALDALAAYFAHAA